MELLFYLHASVAVLSMGMAMITSHSIHALLYAVFSLISLAVSMYVLSAPLAAALEVIVYAGAIMVLFVFAVMLLQTPKPKAPNIAYGKSSIVLALTAFVVFWGEVYIASRAGFAEMVAGQQSLREIAFALFGTYGLLVELISFVLLGGLVVAILVGEAFINSNRTKRLS